jgi:hypothetical protein
MLRLLERSDIGEAMALAARHARHSGTEPVSLVEIEDLLSEINTDTKNRFFGYFDGRDMLSWACLRFGELHGEKTWSISCLFVRHTREHFSWEPPELGLIVKQGFDYAEAHGYYAYVYSIATRLERVYERKWRTNPWLPPRDRYTKDVIARIPAGEKAPQNWMTRMARLPKPDEMSILRRTLKEEYR